MAKPSELKSSETEGLPPFVKSWPKLYMIIVGTLLLLIVLFYGFMIYFE